MLSKIFTWWNGATAGTLLTLWRRNAEFVGEDDQGNKYYEEREPSLAGDLRRRWVVYNGVAEGSRVPSDWHGWMHHTFNEPPTREALPRKSWEKDHVPNMTGTPMAYRPKGSLWSGGERAAATGDYEAWSPDQS